MWGSVGRSVLGPHTLTHFHTPSPFLFPHANTLSHSPHTLSHTPPHTSSLTSPPTLPYISPHTSSHSSSHLSLHPPQHTSPFTPCTLPRFSPHLPHSLDYVAKSYLNKFNRKSLIKFVATTGNLKSCFDVGNVNFWCMKVWRSYHVAKLLATVKIARL